VVQVVEPSKLSERLAYPILPFQLLLDPANGQGYVRKWHEHPLDAGKNRGYALQWFLFGGLATFFYIRQGLKASS
jgi:surfeit locus 1 family protein